MKENEDLEKSLKALQQERSKHQEQYFHKIKLQYNESVLTRNISRQMDLAIALSKAQEINLKLSAEIRQKHKLVKVGAYNIFKFWLTQCLKTQFSDFKQREGTFVPDTSKIVGRCAVLHAGKLLGHENKALNVKSVRIELIFWTETDDNETHVIIYVEI